MHICIKKNRQLLSLPVHRQLWAPVWKARWESCGGSPPGPADSHESCSPLLWCTGNPPVHLSWNVCSDHLHYGTTSITEWGLWPYNTTNTTKPLMLCPLTDMRGCSQFCSRWLWSGSSRAAWARVVLLQSYTNQHRQRHLSHVHFNLEMYSARHHWSFLIVTEK